MTERKHELTDADIKWLAGCAQTGTVQELIDRLPSRQPKDPDAGLGAQPWTSGQEELEVYDASGAKIASVWDALSDEGYDPTAVFCAILATPKAIKLARAWVAARKGHLASLQGPAVQQLDALAAEVIAIADGEAER